MASPAELKQNLPETLPADFGDWDNEPSSAGVIDAPTVAPGDQTPQNIPLRDSAPRDFAPKEATQRSFAPQNTPSREYTPRSVEGERSTAPIPRGPAVPPSPRAFAAPAAKGPRAVPQTSSLPDDEIFFRRIRSLTTVVDKLPPTAAPAEEITRATVATIAPRVEESAPIIEPEEDRAVSFRTDLNDAEDEEERHAKRKMMTIIGVGVGVVALVAFQLFHSGTVSAVKHMVAPQSSTAAAIGSSSLPIANASSPAATTHPLEAKPSASTPETHTADAQPAANQAQSSPAPVQSQMMHDQLLAPTRIPEGARAGGSNDAPPDAGFGGASMAALGGGANTNVFNGSSASKTPSVALKQVTVSAGVAVGMLIHKTQPIYPSIAKAARVTGTVVIQATISKSGAVINPHVVSGPAMLRQAALDAVKTWRYRPYQLNNEPTQVDTTVDVIFALAN